MTAEQRQMAADLWIKHDMKMKDKKILEMLAGAIWTAILRFTLSGLLFSTLDA